MAALEQDEQTPAPERATPHRILLALTAVALLLATLGPLLWSWQQLGEPRARSLTNLRRLADAWQLYGQDWDDRSVPVASPLSNGQWVTWPMRLRSYGATGTVLDNPANAIAALSHPPHDPNHGYVVSTSYALNHRFWNTFAPGPFPIDNLELPAQTVLFVEAGPCWSQPLHQSAHPANNALALLEYGDTMDRVNQRIPYPSTHDGKMAIVAADGHAALVKVEHYGDENGPHDPLFGRLGGDIYNWNGGRPNGEIEQPPKE